jgi:hypothetical protein
MRPLSLPDPPSGQYQRRRGEVNGTTKTGLTSALEQIAEGSVTRMLKEDREEFDRKQADFRAVFA